MAKFVSVLLLLVVCFLVGTLVGIEHNGKSILPVSTNATNTEEKVSTPEVKQTANQKTQETEIVNQQTVAEELSASSTDHLSQKTASFLEVIVQGFYDLIVQILYQISQLFY
jgi:biopolymer transport protein ExbD